MAKYITPAFTPMTTEGHIDEKGGDAGSFKKGSENGLNYQIIRYTVKNLK